MTRNLIAAMLAFTLASCAPMATADHLSPGGVKKTPWIPDDVCWTYDEWQGYQRHFHLELIDKRGYLYVYTDGKEVWYAIPLNETHACVINLETMDDYLGKKRRTT